MDKKTFFAAVRSYTHSNVMFNRFNETDSDLTIRDFNNYFVTEQGTYLLLWYSLLFNVCAFLKNQDAIPDSIKDDVTDIYDQWNDLRNVVFHIPPAFFDDRFRILLSPKSFQKISRIHRTLSDYFNTELVTFGEETDLTP
jgi:hypothetical protein